MLLRRDIVEAMNVSYNRTFTDALEEASESALVSTLVTETTSTAGRENYAWMLDYVRMRKWIGEREVSDDEVREYFIRNDEYEATVKTKIRDIQDGVYALQAQSKIQQLADAYPDYKNDFIVDLMLNGFDGKGPDGVPFFSEEHPWGHIEKVENRGAETYQFVADGQFSNMTDAEFSEDALWNAREAMRKFKNHKGRTANVRPDTLVVGPALEREARKLLTYDRIVKVEGGTPIEQRNESQGLYTLIVEDRLDDSGRWFLFDSSKRIKPFIFQLRQAPIIQMTSAFTPTANQGEIDFYAFTKNEILHGIYARFGGGYGVPAYAYASTAGE